MATIKIKDLPEANQISDSNLVILEDADTTRKAAGQTLIHYVENHPDINSHFLTRDSLGAAGEAAASSLPTTSISARLQAQSMKALKGKSWKMLSLRLLKV